MSSKFPPWLKRRLPPPEQTEKVRRLLAELGLNTVCREAHCPNRGECYASGTAALMILGRLCTRDCRFCAVESGAPGPVDPEEPHRVALAVRRLALRHVVITSVTRDDLPDGGSAHFAATIRAVHTESDATVEALTPDFQGRRADVLRVLDERPEVFNHNVETTPRLYGEVRPQANYQVSLQVLRWASQCESAPIVKSGLMLGLGERQEELEEVFRDLVASGCRALTLGQYLAPSKEHYPVHEFVPPERFEQLRRMALAMGFEQVISGPFVRSSYRAAETVERLLERTRSSS
ncbi:MAG: lipoyl synthase [Planctomycetes bacterium]|nr:lipoyl synthase [Planctomycetota bacterium]